MAARAGLHLHCLNAAKNCRKGFEMFRAFWRWCASRDEYKGIIDPQAVESPETRSEVPSRKTKRFDVLERAHLAPWFVAVRELGNPVISAYLQALLLTECLQCIGGKLNATLHTEVGRGQSQQFTTESLNE